MSKDIAATNEEEILAVGTEVLILNGMWKNQWSVITEVLAPADDDPVRYDVAASPGRWYYRDELSIKGESRVCRRPEPMGALVNFLQDVLNDLEKHHG